MIPATPAASKKQKQKTNLCYFIAQIFAENRAVKTQVGRQCPSFYKRFIQ
jgi:hypothetical protein